MAVLFLLSLICVSAPPAHGSVINLVTNGSFESTSLSSPGGYICAGPGSTCNSTITAWTSTCHGATCGTSATVASLLFPGTNGSAFNGNRGLWSSKDSPDGGNYVAIDGDPTYNASISQTITGLIPGQYYALTFFMAAAQQSGTTGNNTEQWQVTFGADQQTSTTMSNPSKGFQDWIQQQMIFKAANTSQVLTFLAIGTPNGGPPVVLLDGVRMSQVPEPVSFGIVAFGLVLVPLAKRLRRKRSK